LLLIFLFCRLMKRGVFEERGSEEEREGEGEGWERAI
jgi:hypothetical protein